MIILKKSKIFIIIAIIALFIASFIDSHGEVVEELEIPSGVGIDVEKRTPYTTYSIPILVYSFEENGKVISNILNGKAKSIGETRSERQLKSSQRFLLGFSKLFVISEDMSEFGIKNLIDILIDNPEINDKAICIVCKGKAINILSYKSPGNPNYADYLEKMIRNLNQFNFFSSQYSLIDSVVRLNAEGRNLLLPYVEITDEGIKTTGLAIFKGDKMVAKSDIDETRIINILKENNVKGILTLQKNPHEYLNFYAASKRKVKCYNEGGKYKFIINLYLKGSIVSNELYPGIAEDSKEMKAFQNDMAYHVEEMCNNVINKIKNEYKVDVLDLGMVAAAKYGRGTGTDWNEIVNNSDIKVNVNVKVTSQGRGDY